MSARRTGVATVPGFLSHYLDDLGLTRQELARRVGTSVRTIHNVEHGRKRVDSDILVRVAAALNRHAQALYPDSRPLGLTKDHFIQAPQAVVSVAMQTILLNRPDFLLHEDALVDPSLRWCISGDPERLPWTGQFDLASLPRQIEAFYRCFQYLGVENSQLYLAPQQYAAVVKTDCNIRHPDTGAQTKFRSFIEFDVAGSKLRAMHSTFDSERVATFLESGQPP